MTETANLPIPMDRFAVSVYSRRRMWTDSKNLFFFCIFGHAIIEAILEKVQKECAAMFKNFAEIERYLNENKIVKKVALAGAQDDIALAAVVRARRNGFIDPILVGDQEKIEALLSTMGEQSGDYRIIDEKREMKTARLAISLVKNGEADFPMKGLMQTATFLMAVQNPMGGIAEAGAQLNEVTVFEYPEQERMLIAGDCAVNIAPNLEQKKHITENLIRVARAYHCDDIKVAAVSVLEKPNPEIQSTMDAAALSEMSWGDGVTVEGPFALDNALDLEAARHKGIESKVAGRADVLVMPDIHAGNVFHKCIHFFGHYRFSSGLLGAECPIIMNSRTDDVDAKYYSILSAILLSL